MSANSRSCSSTVGTWWSIVNVTAPLNRPSSNGIAVASASTTSTLRVGHPAGQRGGQRGVELDGGERRARRARSRSVVSPGPGPISTTSSPRSAGSSAPKANGRARSSRVWRHSSVASSCRCMSFIGLDGTEPAACRRGRTVTVHVAGTTAPRPRRRASPSQRFDLPVRSPLRAPPATRPTSWRGRRGAWSRWASTTGCGSLPRSRALWIPAGTHHDVRSDGVTTMMGIYFRARARARSAGPEPTIVDTSGLLGDLLEHLADDLEPGPRRRVEAVVFDLLPADGGGDHRRAGPGRRAGRRASPRP